VGEIGDVVVGRITAVSSNRWIVDTQNRLDSVLKLSSVNLPGGVLVCMIVICDGRAHMTVVSSSQRRKSATDELMMREVLKEGDLICAEVQAIFQEDGTLSLHTRSLRYGKVCCGTYRFVTRRTPAPFLQTAGPGFLCGGAASAD
jgi:exosome complex component RRP4